MRDETRRRLRDNRAGVEAVADPDDPDEWDERAAVLAEAVLDRLDSPASDATAATEEVF
jgi:hypothetical protein